MRTGIKSSGSGPRVLRNSGRRFVASLRAGRHFHDELSGGLSLNGRDEFDPASVPFYFRSAYDFFKTVVSTFYEEIGPQFVDQTERRELSKHGYIIDRLQCGDNASTISGLNQRPLSALNLLHRGIIVNGHDQNMCKRLRAVQELNVTCVQQVETAIGEYDFLALRMGNSDNSLQLLQINDFPVGALLLLVECCNYFIGLNRRGSHLTYFYTGGNIGKTRGARQIFSGKQYASEHTDYGVSRSGDIENVANFGLDMQLIAICLKDSHSLLTTSDCKSLAADSGNDAFGGLTNFRFSLHRRVCRFG